MTSPSFLSISLLFCMLEGTDNPFLQKKPENELTHKAKWTNSQSRANEWMKRKKEPGRRERLPGYSLITREAAKFVTPGSETRILGMSITLCGARRVRGQGALPKVKSIGIQKALF